MIAYNAFTSITSLSWIISQDKYCCVINVWGTLDHSQRFYKPFPIISSSLSLSVCVCHIEIHFLYGYLHLHTLATSLLMLALVPGWLPQLPVLLHAEFGLRFFQIKPPVSPLPCWKIQLKPDHICSWFYKLSKMVIDGH